MRTFLTILLVAWAALAVPSICRAGMLEHECACGIASDCTHEESCSSDPCSVANPTTPAKFAFHDLNPLSFAPAPSRRFALPLPNCDRDWARVTDDPGITSSLHPGARPLRN